MRTSAEISTELGSRPIRASTNSALRFTNIADRTRIKRHVSGCCTHSTAQTRQPRCQPSRHAFGHAVAPAATAVTGGLFQSARGSRAGPGPCARRYPGPRRELAADDATRQVVGVSDPLGPRPANRLENKIWPTSWRPLRSLMRSHTALAQPIHRWRLPMQRLRQPSTRI